MRRVIGVITARMASTRCPGKVLKKLGDKSIFERHVERMKQVQGLNGVFLATSTDPLNEALIQEAKRLECGWFSGAEQDVVDRHIQLCQQEKADAVIRVTCDSPIFDIESTSCLVEAFKKEYWDFGCVSNMTMIQGTLTELISLEALKEVHKHHRGPAVTLHIKENPSQFKMLNILLEHDLCRPEYRLTIDEPADIEMIDLVYRALDKGSPLSLRTVYTWLDDNPQVAKINRHVGVKECEQLSAHLTEMPTFSVVRSGKKFVILDEQKRMIEPEEFMETIKEMFTL
ncbi:MAG: hypothetical protein GY858_03020 [Candidatus Omnitrophica bacterium]|nr:hypothetical protein [Candidatus Omnitrophota bacterium]